MRALKLSLSVLLALASPCAAERTLIADVEFSSATARTQRRSSGLLSEGKPLEVLVWGSGGAVAGSLAGPVGAVIGAGVGALCGLVYSVFVVPRNGPGKSPAVSTIDNHSPRGE